MDKLWITVLYVAGFLLPAIGITRIVVGVYVDRYRNRRNAELNAEITARHEPIIEQLKQAPATPDKAHNISNAQNAMNAERRARGVRYLSIGAAQEVMNRIYLGNTDQRLTVAWYDVAFIGAGLLASTIASIWSVWLAT